MENAFPEKLYSKINMMNKWNWEKERKRKALPVYGKWYLARCIALHLCKLETHRSAFKKTNFTTQHK